MRLKCSVVIALLLAGLSMPAYGDIHTMILEGLSYDRGADVAHVVGAGRIVSDGGMGQVLARRAAVADAQRGFLILKRGIIEGKPFRTDSVSGRVPPFRIVSEYVRDGMYFVEAETSLSELIGRKEDTNEEVSIDCDDDDTLTMWSIPSRDTHPGQNPFTE